MHLLELIIIFAIVVMVPKVNAQQKCFVVLNPNGCGLETCGKECFQQHNGNGVCEMSSFGKGHNLHTVSYVLFLY
jgi:hypothetical protein